MHPEKEEAAAMALILMNQRQSFIFNNLRDHGELVYSGANKEEVDWLVAQGLARISPNSVVTLTEAGIEESLSFMRDFIRTAYDWRLWHIIDDPKTRPAVVELAHEELKRRAARSRARSASKIINPPCISDILPRPSVAARIRSRLAKVLRPHPSESRG